MSAPRRGQRSPPPQYWNSARIRYGLAQRSHWPVQRRRTSPYSGWAPSAQSVPGAKRQLTLNKCRNQGRRARIAHGVEHRVPFPVEAVEYGGGECDVVPARPWAVEVRAREHRLGCRDPDAQAVSRVAICRRDASWPRLSYTPDNSLWPTATTDTERDREGHSHDCNCDRNCKLPQAARDSVAMAIQPLVETAIIRRAKDRDLHVRGGAREVAPAIGERPLCHRRQYRAARGTVAVMARSLATANVCAAWQLQLVVARRRRLRAPDVLEPADVLGSELSDLCRGTGVNRPTSAWSPQRAGS